MTPPRMRSLFAGWRLVDQGWGSVERMGPPSGVGAGTQSGAQQAVDDEVGIAADGRGEVGVAGAGEGEVAFVLFAVAGLFERAQHEEAEDAFLGRCRRFWRSGAGTSAA